MIRNLGKLTHRRLTAEELAGFWWIHELRKGLSPGPEGGSRTCADCEVDIPDGRQWSPVASAHDGFQFLCGSCAEARTRVWLREMWLEGGGKVGDSTCP